MTLRALVFDFDGLLVDTETPAYRSWVEIYGEHGHELPQDRWNEYMGRESGWFDACAYLDALVGGGLDRAAVKARRDARRDALLEGADLLPGARELIAAAKAAGLSVGVASSSSDRWVCGHLDRLAYRDAFDVITCRTPDIRAKPAPDIYLAALARLGVAPREAVALEDTRNGVLAAKAAGLWCVAVPNAITASHDVSAADLRVSSLAGIRLEDLVALTSR